MHYLGLLLLLEIYLFVFISLLVTLPSQFILLNSLISLINFGQYYRNHFESWNDNEISETRLLLHNINGLSVAQECNIFIIVPFNVTLIEKFLKQQVRPIFQSFEFPRESGKIARVKQEL